MTLNCILSYAVLALFQVHLSASLSKSSSKPLESGNCVIFLLSTFVVVVVVGFIEI